MMGLLAFSALTIDLGMVWVVRAELQNAADAAALAGGVSLTKGARDQAVPAAQTMAQQHTVLGQPIDTGSVAPFLESCPDDPAGAADCVRVTVSAPPLPVLFSGIFGAAGVPVHATATAAAVNGNTTTCMRPWAVPDRWLESAGLWNFSSQFVSPADTYTRPTSTDPGTGYRSIDDPQTEVGADVVFRYGRFDGTAVITADVFLGMDLPRLGDTGMSAEDRGLANIVTCNGLPVTVGGTYPLYDHNRELTQTAGQELIPLDPEAEWDPVARTVRSPLGTSPRIVPVATYDPLEFWSQVRPGPNLHVVVTNIVGFFVEESRDGALFGRIVSIRGTSNPASGLLTPESSDLRSIALVR
jgi:hypothetical protein